MSLGRTLTYRCHMKLVGDSCSVFGDWPSPHWLQVFAKSWSVVNITAVKKCALLAVSMSLLLCCCVDYVDAQYDFFFLAFLVKLCVRTELLVHYVVI